MAPCIRLMPVAKLTLNTWLMFPRCQGKKSGVARSLTQQHPYCLPNQIPTKNQSRSAHHECQQLVGMQKTAQMLRIIRMRCLYIDAHIASLSTNMKYTSRGMIKVTMVNVLAAPAGSKKLCLVRKTHFATVYLLLLLLHLSQTRSFV